jgi:hypothetical protein
VILYLDDLKEILALASARFSEIEIQGEGYKYASLDDVISTKGRRPKELLIQFPPEPSMFHLHLGGSQKNSLETMTAESDLFQSVKSLLEQRRRALNQFSLGFVAIVPSLLGLALMMRPSSEVGIPPLIEGVVIGILLFVPAALTLWLRQAEDSFFNQIILEKQHEADSFWKRNKDKIWLLLIGTLFGILGTLFTQWILGVLSAKAGG